MFLKTNMVLVTVVLIATLIQAVTANDVNIDEDLQRIKRQSIKGILTTLGSSVQDKDNARLLPVDGQQLSAMIQMAENIELLEKKIDGLTPKYEALLHKQHQTIQKQTEIITKLNQLHKNMEADMDETIDMQSKIMDKINKLDANLATIRTNMEQNVRTQYVPVEYNPNNHQKGNMFIAGKDTTNKEVTAESQKPKPFLTGVETDIISEYSNQNTIEKQTNGSTISRNQPDQTWVQQVGECGGVMVAEKGKIFFVGDEGVGSDMRCVWTIRANRKSEVHIKLIEDELGSNFITITDYTDVYWNNNATYHSMKKKTAKLLTGDRAMYVLDGPLVFVTLFYSRPAKYAAKLPPRFKLTFEGAGEDIPSEWKFTHHHITQVEGAIKYPVELGGKYLPNEVVTIVLNPQPFPIHVNMSYYDFEVEEDCNSDSLTYLTLDGSSEPFFAPLGPPNQIKRYCGRNTVPQRVGKTKWIDALITILKSDQSNEYTGFRIVWSDTDTLSPFHILQRWKA